ncbi:hypothetical protein H257_02110 [Aphanomyces astaci]|uniref:Uncharacterized protein n=1 Tax=Aphanomyces astaci TaxID=112090 RepID=W4H754_APHAT|nr:hypothetical protein H257_02110 [Aphanomyces astaci]ETV87114.1 hypothetical protein H257_02110 [Aphanomyces astaci]|eukprot:XP_009823913.1 hypothetical protein H257_02110 [Aphanomyces astaci]
MKAVIWVPSGEISHALANQCTDNAYGYYCCTTKTTTVTTTSVSSPVPSPTAKLTSTTAKPATSTASSMASSTTSRSPTTTTHHTPTTSPSNDINSLPSSTDPIVNALEGDPTDAPANNNPSFKWRQGHRICWLVD